MRKTNKLKALVSIIYFFQGFSLSGLALSLYFKEQLNFSITTLALMGAIISSPWLCKVLFGIASDSYPLFGYRRKSYLVISTVLGAIIWTILALIPSQNFWFFTTLFFFASLFSAIIDVVVDGLTVSHSLDGKDANEFQTLSWGSRSFASLVSGVISGWVVGKIDIQILFFIEIPLHLIQLPFILALYEARVIKENVKVNVKRVIQNIVSPFKEFFGNKQLLLISLFSLLGMFSPSYGLPFFYRMRDNLNFSAQFIGILASVGAVGGIIGFIIFNKYLSNIPIKRLLYVSVFIWACNTASVLLIVDKPTAICVSIIGDIFGFMSFIPTMSIAAKLCSKTTHQATLFALLMAIHNISSTGSSLLGSWLYKFVGFTPLVIISTFTTFLCLPILKYIKED